MNTRALFGLLVLVSSLACTQRTEQELQQAKTPAASETRRDFHSHSNPAELKVRHVDLDLDVRFEQRILEGTAVLHLEKTPSGTHSPIILDTRDLRIKKVEISEEGVNYKETPFSLGTSDPILGASLSVPLPEKVSRMRIHYSTSPEASALQWLNPSQTAGKKHPFLYSQSEPIHARSWIPLQDSPGVKITYTARLRTPKNLLAVMSAKGNPQIGSAEMSTKTAGHTARSDQGQTAEYRFNMTQPIPSYLIALAVGDLVFASLGDRTGVYAEPSVIERAATEFSDTEKMLEATERVYGAYRWDRYDILVLPPSFPLGGMENPRLTFATPTILAGDKSLVALVAHELAHSWSGNLVTNSTWSDFWLNEGFTTYLQNRIIEELYGRSRSEMEAVLGRRNLEKELKSLEPRDEILHVDLEGRDPDAGFTDVPYEKGALFLRHLEETYGRARFDSFLRGYFDHFAFQSITTAGFVDYLKENFLEAGPKSATSNAGVPVEEWIYQPGIPAVAPQPRSDAFARVEQQTQQWLQGQVPASKLDAARWTTQEWLHFLSSLPPKLDEKKMQELDQAFHFTQSGNSEILHQWLLMAISNQYAVGYPRLEAFLTSVGRRKFLKPLYEELMKTPEGRERARSIYRKARSFYHPIAVSTVDEIVGWKS